MRRQRKARGYLGLYGGSVSTLGGLPFQDRSIFFFLSFLEWNIYIYIHIHWSEKIWTIYDPILRSSTMSPLSSVEYFFICISPRPPKTTILRTRFVFMAFFPSFRPLPFIFVSFNTRRLYEKYKMNVGPVVRPVENHSSEQKKKMKRKKNAKVVSFLKEKFLQPVAGVRSGHHAHFPGAVRKKISVIFLWFGNGKRRPKKKGRIHYNCRIINKDYQS